jgi:NAD(P)-dependent dehydrogenase (short-subunit alcohol dehydrogenase family)
MYFIMQSLQNKTVVITGATSGIGLATAVKLAGMGFSVIGVGRSPEKCDAAIALIKKECGLKAEDQGDIVFLTADLSSMASVRELARKIRNELTSAGRSSLDVLINNAGAVSSWYVTTAEGFELQFAVNYLAAFLLTRELLPLLEASPEGRIIALSSGSHYRMRINWNDILMRKRYNCLMAYKQTKLAVVMFCAELNRRLGNGSRLRAFAADPGLVNTDIGLKGTTGIARKIWEMRSGKGIPPEEAAANIAWLASAEEPPKAAEVYWKECRPVKPSRYSLKQYEAQRLWEISEKMCGIIGAGVPDNCTKGA